MVQAILTPVVEFFTLRRAAKDASRLTDEWRKKVRELGDLARQRAEAAESLWAAGHPAEALRLMLDGLERMGEAVRVWFEGVGEQLDGSDRRGQEQREGGGGENAAKAMEVPSAHKVPFAVFERFIQVRNKGEGALRRIQEAKSKIEAMKLPLLDSEVSPAHGELFEALVDVRLIVARSLGEVSILPREIFVKRIVRSGIAGFAFFAGVVGLYLAFHVPEGIHARASSYFNNHPDYEPSKALDGNPDTSWLLPDHTRGWFEITINPPRTISKVKILNTHNPPYNDRATIDYTLKVFAKGKEVKSFNGHTEFSVSPQWITHELGNAVEGVDRVRFEVHSWYNFGGGLAEITVE